MWRISLPNTVTDWVRGGEKRSHEYKDVSYIGRRYSDYAVTSALPTASPAATTCNPRKEIATKDRPNK